MMIIIKESCHIVINWSDFGEAVHSSLYSAARDWVEPDRAELELRTCPEQSCDNFQLPPSSKPSAYRASIEQERLSTTHSR